jgi:hypothetical protein
MRAKPQTEILRIGPVGVVPMSMMLGAALLALAAVLLVAAQEPARATFPGANGKIAFMSDRDGNDEIYVMNADGSGQTRCTNNTALDWEPDWGPVVGSCTISGNNGDNVLNGTPAYEVICGLGGDDRIRGLGATDRIRGGVGNDTLYGGEGDDLVFGEEGDDIVNTIDSVEGNDVAVGGSGRDSCRTDPEDRKLSCEP